ncbi:bac41291-80b8-486a-b54a-af131468b93b [Thermothielavioides terrestris]|uniref:Large ribosomal subunit protein mL46 n=1 Tax=Thermothielavioides terrestris TaxID=2587410 RepID=A0A3S4APQ4_9PEZI|nr:bac41291-80b8-486a-b54a-af131468b93b [Thermothielavioides terrestris]
MSAPGRGSALLRSSHRVCSQCARPAPRTPRPSAAASQPSPALGLAVPLTARRYYAAEAAEAADSLSQQASTTAPPPVTTAPDPETPTPAAARYCIKSSLILTRPPLLTREPTPFEAAYYLYQKRLNERLTAPFRRAFYFKQDSAADLDFRIKLRERRGVPAKDIGRYNPRGRMAWNDEVMVGSRLADPAEVRDRLLADAEVRADLENDVRRLDRKLDRTLYLVVKRATTGGAGREAKAEGEAEGQGEGEGEDGVWEFPTAVVPTHEALHETAARALEEAAGVNMNTWIVGRAPVAHRVVEPVLGPDGVSVVQRGEKIFFLKGRIMAGQADLTGNKLGLTDFKWLTKEELQEVLPLRYFLSVRKMMDLR